MTLVLTAGLLAASVNSAGAVPPSGRAELVYSATPIAENLRMIATADLGLGDDEVSAAVPIGFDFVFFGVAYSEVYVSSNGFLSFDAAVGDGCCSGDPLPQDDDVNNVIAGYWDDLYGSHDGGQIRVDTQGAAPNREFIVDFDAVEYCCSGPEVVNFQMILHESGAIEFQYGAMDAESGEDSTVSVGVEDATGSRGLQIALDGNNAVSAALAHSGVLLHRSFLPDPVWGASQWVTAGGSVFTGGARPDDPLAVRVTSPNAGFVSVTQGESAGISGYSILGRVVAISAPSATPGNPLVIVFTMDSSLFTDGLTPADVMVFRNGAAVAECSGVAGVASPDPCLSATGMDGDDYTFTVLTSLASTWVLGAEEASPERTCRGLVATIVGTSGDDTLTGTAADDVIWAGAGDDVVSGLGGRDIICLGAGDDEAHGGGSRDRIFGGDGADSLFGDKGDDTLRGGPGADTGAGGPGTDRCLAVETATTCEL